MKMKRSYLLIVLLVLGVPVASAQPGSETGVPDIMTPERASPPPKHKTRRGSSSIVYPTPLTAAG